MQLTKGDAKWRQLFNDVHDVRVKMEEATETLESLIRQIAKYRKAIEDCSDEYDSCDDDV